MPCLAARKLNAEDEREGFINGLQLACAELTRPPTGTSPRWYNRRLRIGHVISASDEPAKSSKPTPTLNAPISETDPSDSSVWALKPGAEVERKELQQRYGGRTQGGIGPSKSSPNVLIFSDPIAGEPHGYFDGWRADGYFHYTGEGQRGDQQMKSGNAAILNHASEGRALRLFLGARGRVTYEGEFELAREQPFYTTDAPETNNGPVRSVIVFRLQPVDTKPEPSSSKLDRVGLNGVEDVPVEEQWTEKVFVAPSQVSYEADRREQKLVLAFRDYLLQQRHEVTRLKIAPPGEAKPLFADLIDRTTNTLYEAKGSVQRGAIRTAIGQLMDYRRFVQPSPRLAVLLPSRPRDDLLDLLTSVDVGIVWRDGDHFAEVYGEDS